MITALFGAARMKLTRSRALAGLLLLGGAGFLALNVVAYNHAYAMTHFAGTGPRPKKPEEMPFTEKLGVLLGGLQVPRPRGTSTPADFGLAFESCRIPSTSGLVLGAWHVPRSDARALAIVVHGYAAEKSTVLREAAALHALGCAILLIDLRGGGESSDSPTSIGYFEAEDIAAAVAYARRTFAPRRLLLFGHSMGAIAILRAHRVHAIQADAVIVEAVFDSLLNTVRRRFDPMPVPSFPSAELLVFWGGRQLGFDGFAHRPIDDAAGMNAPILFLQGERDPSARVEDGRRVFAAVRSPKRFHIFPGVGHENAIARAPEEWRSVVGEFLANALPAPLPD